MPRLGLGHLREHESKHGLQDTLNPLCIMEMMQSPQNIFSSTIPNF